MLNIPTSNDWQKYTEFPTYGSTSNFQDDFSVFNDSNLTNSPPPRFRYKKQYSENSLLSPMDHYFPNDSELSCKSAAGDSIDEKIFNAVQQ
jgi:hypothetical protein